MSASLEALLNQRILILDGAMGTMIQQRKLDEAAFRGERFKDWQKSQKGHNDLLNLTQPSRSRVCQTCCEAGHGGRARSVVLCGRGDWTHNEDIVYFNRCQQSCGARHHL